MPFNGDWYKVRNNTKPWVRRKDRKLYWSYPWIGFNGRHTAEFRNWEDAMLWIMYCQRECTSGNQ